MTYGQALRTLMKKQGVSQIELASRYECMRPGSQFCRMVPSTSKTPTNLLPGRATSLHRSGGGGGVFCVDDV